jgi:hypothetical protein
VYRVSIVYLLTTLFVLIVSYGGETPFKNGHRSPTSTGLSNDVANGWKLYQNVYEVSEK